MSNHIIHNDVLHSAEYIWRSKYSAMTKDSNGKRLPFPKEATVFGDKDAILKRLNIAQHILHIGGHFKKNITPINCLICAKKNIDTKQFYYDNWLWGNGSIHYIKTHNVEPSVQFKDFIYNVLFSDLETDLSKALDIGHLCDPNSDRDGYVLYKNARCLGLLSNKNNKNDTTTEHSNRGKKYCRSIRQIKAKSILERVKINNVEFVKLEKNKILILDALLFSGGKFKKYTDPYDKNIKRYSEHAGFLDFDNGSLQKIVVSGQTDRVNEKDNEIYLPKDMDEMFDYEYIFHTHPPTPRPGGRVDIGIIYEVPSCGDILHFIDHYNEGNVVGSLVITPEGLYNIRRYYSDDELIGRLKTKKMNANNDVNNIEHDAIIIDDDELYDDYRKIFKKIQKDAITLYGDDFSTETFFSEIAQNMTYITRMNHSLNRHHINIDYYPRKKDGRYWYINTVYLKIQPHANIPVLDE